MYSKFTIGRVVIKEFKHLKKGYPPPVLNKLNLKPSSLYDQTDRGYSQLTNNVSDQERKQKTDYDALLENTGHHNLGIGVSEFVRYLQIKRFSTRQQHLKAASAKVVSNESVVGSHPEAPEVDDVDMFGDHALVYSSKSLWELIRTRAFFFLCRFNYLTDNAERVIALTQKVFGRRISQFLIRKSVYDQFVGGSCQQEIKEVANNLHSHGVGLLLAVPMEDDAGSAQSQASKELQLDKNLEQLLNSIKLCKEVEKTFPMFQLKGTALMTGDLAKEVTSRNGPGVDKKLLEAVVLGMQGTIIDFSKIPGWEDFTAEKNEELNKVLRRFQEVNKAILSHDVISMMDAEYTYMNPTLRLFTLAMAQICSKDKARMFYTYQAYLKSTLGTLNEDIRFAKEYGYHFGAKLVRGAYMIKERKLAKTLGYEDPVQPSFEKTCENYHRCVDALLERAEEDQETTKFIICTHNEDSVYYTVKRMEKLGLPRDGNSVFFGQLYGMADHISFTLGDKKYRVFKSIPYGSVDDTVPYLARRAQENKSILDNARRENDLVTRALKDRLLFRN